MSWSPCTFLFLFEVHPLCFDVFNIRYAGDLNHIYEQTNEIVDISYQKNNSIQD